MEVTLDYERASSRPSFMAVIEPVRQFIAAGSHFESGRSAVPIRRSLQALCELRRPASQRSKTAPSHQSCHGRRRAKNLYHRVPRRASRFMSHASEKNTDV